MNSTTLRNRKIADAIDGVAIAWARNAIDSDLHGHAMTECYYTDAHYLYEIANLVRTRNFKEAAQLASHLEFIVQDQIPSRTWNWLMSKS